jgi:hypothetical protein
MSGWPALPIAIRHIGGPRFTSESGVEGAGNIIAGLEHNDRVFDIVLSDVPSWQLKIFVAAMQKPFPQLTSLTIGAANSEAHNCDPFFDLSRIPPTLRGSFLGGSAPSLQSLRLDGIPFPGLLKLLSASHHLVDIHIWDFSYCSVYIPLEEMITCLSPMKHLEQLDIKFNHKYSSRAARRPPPSLTRIVLPALTALKVNCTVGFLEGFMSRLDAPSLKEMVIKCPWPFSNISELPRFISRIKTFETFDQAIVHIHREDIQFVFSLQTSSVAGAELSLTFEPVVPEFIEDLPPVVCSLLPPLSRFNCLMLHEHRNPDFPIQNIANIPMEEILYSFTGVTNIFISKFMATSVSQGMELSQAGERATEMLPALRNIFVAELRGQEECTHSAIQQFIAAKGLAGRPVTLHPWEPEAED